MEDGPVPLADVRRFFTPGSMARDPPNIIDESIEKFGVAYDLPQTVAATNLMVSSSAAYAARPGEADPVPFRPDLVMSGRNSRARFHVDSGFAVYHELFEGTKLWALLNFEEGKRFGMPHRMPSRLAELAKYPSLVLCTLRAGEALYTPPGWWHFVVSEEPSLVRAVLLLLPLSNRLTRSPPNLFTLGAEQQHTDCRRLGCRHRPVLQPERGGRGPPGRGVLAPAARHPRSRSEDRQGGAAAVGGREEGGQGVPEGGDGAAMTLSEHDGH